jgi:citrate lyase subunit beta / citryl-CoA lyase
MMDAFEKAQAEGRAALIYDGEHIDYAHVKTAREIVEQARQFASDNQSNSTKG